MKTLLISTLVFIFFAAQNCQAEAPPLPAGASDPSALLDDDIHLPPLPGKAAGAKPAPAGSLLPPLPSQTSGLPAPRGALPTASAQSLLPSLKPVAAAGLASAPAPKPVGPSLQSLLPPIPAPMTQNQPNPTPPLSAPPRALLAGAGFPIPASVTSPAPKAPMTAAPLLPLRNPAQVGVLPPPASLEKRSLTLPDSLSNGAPKLGAILPKTLVPETVQAEKNHAATPPSPEVSIILVQDRFYPSRIRVHEGQLTTLVFTTVNRKPAALILERLNEQRWVAGEEKAEIRNELERARFELNREIGVNRLTEIPLELSRGTYTFHDALTGARGEIVVESSER